ncbi:MAG: hypothetical protein ACREDF_03840, partial [Thermoplasmata archaeon]
GLHGDGGMDLRTQASLWGTPRVTSNGGYGAVRENDRSRIEDQAAAWSSPKARDFRSAEGKAERNTPDLNVQTKAWPTPKVGTHGEPGSGKGHPTILSAWATPRAHHHPGQRPDGKGGKSVDHQARNWQTPSVADVTGGHMTRGGERLGELLLKGYADKWTTPTADDTGTRTKPYAQGGSALSLQVQGSGSDGPKSSESLRTLNPQFVEWLMGLPIGWIDCARSATESYRSWLQLHSSILRAALD